MFGRNKKKKEEMTTEEDKLFAGLPTYEETEAELAELRAQLAEVEAREAEESEELEDIIKSANAAGDEFMAKMGSSRTAPSLEELAAQVAKQKAREARQQAASDAAMSEVEDVMREYNRNHGGNGGHKTLAEREAEENGTSTKRSIADHSKEQGEYVPKPGRPSIADRSKEPQTLDELIAQQEENS